MRISSFQAAKTMCHISKWSLSNLQLQKLLYLAHMVSLGRNMPLIDEEFSAWMYGPVLPALYDRVKLFGTSFVRDRFYHEEVLSEQDERYQLLKEIYNILGEKKGWELVALTHRPGGAWTKNYNGNYNVTIPEQDILAEYKDITSKNSDE